MPQHVIWDWNGTLLDDARICVSAINVLLRRRRLPPVSLRRYRDLFGFPVRSYYEAIGFQIADAEWPQVAAEYHAVYAALSRQAPLRRGTLRTLRFMKRRGWVLSILSASEANLLHRMVAERGILAYFQRIAGLTDFFAHSKESLGRALMRDTDIPASRTLLIGDTIHDYEVARHLGCRCLLMAGGHQSAQRLRRCGVPLVTGMTAVTRQLPARR
jgi:phosphoglycolate phosphatase